MMEVEHTKEFIQEGKGRVYFASSNRSDVFYNPGRDLFHNPMFFMSDI